MKKYTHPHFYSFIFNLFSFVLILFSFVLITSCSEDGTGPKPKPPGYQEDIPWPSLADTPWPIFHGDPQSTGRSNFTGPTEGVISKVFEAKDSQSGVIVGYDLTFYFTTRTELVSAEFSGKVNWKLQIGSELTTTPLMTQDSFLVISNGGNILAIDLDGKIAWEYKTGAGVYSLTLGIDLGGNIYFIDSNNNLTVLSNNGALLWYLQDERLAFFQGSTLSFSPDGNTLYLQGIDVSLLAINLDNHSVKWVFGERRLNSGPIIDTEGNIYIFPDAFPNQDNYFYCLGPSGEIRWQFKHDELYQLNNIEPAIDKNGNIYFGYNNLYSLDYNGNLNWKLKLEGGISTSILCDRSDNIYFSVDGTNFLREILCVSNSGKIVWQLTVENEREFSSSAAIAEEGLLIYSAWRSNNIYVIE
jgi:PQQ-like domain